jgi:hypothetical protein
MSGRGRKVWTEMQSLLEVPLKTLLFFIVEKRYVSTYEKLDRILVTTD